MGGGSHGWVRGRCLGRGSTATVYLGAAATSGERQSRFAVKSAELSRSAALQREQKILSSLCSPHVVSCLGSDVTAEPDGRVLYNLFLEYVPGGSVSEVAMDQGGLDEGTVRVYTRGILDGLAYLHSRGIVHCDVKGQNVLVGEDGVGVKVADLGCARWVDDGRDGGGAIRGTPLYMAPEVARGEEQRPVADIWALGCTVIEMATGRPPWRDVADPVAAIHRIAFSTDVPDFPCNVSEDARDFLGRCLNRDPRKRWPAEELLTHPFVSCREESPTGCVSDSKKNSPKSTLDQDFWDSWPEEEEEEEAKAKSDVNIQAVESPQGRLRHLVGGRVNATWADSCWITVRNGVAGSSSCCLVFPEASAGERSELEVPTREEKPSTSCWVSAKSSDCCDCVMVKMEGCPLSNPYSHFSVSPDNVILSRNVLSMHGGNGPFVYNESSPYASLRIS